MRRWMWIVLVALWAVGCTPRPEGAVVADTPRGGWHFGEEVAIDYTNSDTLSLYNVGVALRMESGKVDSAPMTFQVGCVAPSGAFFSSDVVLQAKEVHSGGSFTEIKTLWVENALFGESGDYTFILTPGLDVEGVWMAGVTIEKTR